MSSQEQNNRQQEFNDFLERELELREENQAFLGETLSIGAQIADQIQFQLGKVSQKLTLDKEILKASKENVNIVKRLDSSYSSLNDVQRDQVKIQKQIQSNQNIIAAKSKDITKEESKAARAFIEREKSIEKQQSLTADLLKQQEEMEAQFRAQEDAGKSLSQEQINQRVVMEANIKASQTKTAELTKQQIAAEKMVNPQAVSVELLKDQNKELEKADEYLSEQEGYIKQTIKNQALWNVSLGAAEGFLKKLGLESANLSFGLEEGSAAAQQMAIKLSDGGKKSLGFIDQVKVLGAGIGGTIQGMSKALKQFLAAGFFVAMGKTIGKLFAMPLKPMVGFIKDLKSKFFEGLSYVKDQFFSLNSYIADAKAGETFLQQMSKATADLATNLGVGTQEAKALVVQAGKVSASLGMMPEELAATTAELQKSFGTTQKFSDDTVKTMGQLTNLLGLSNEEASEFVKLSQLSGKEASDTTLTYKTQIQALKERENIAISEKEIMQEIAKSSAAQQLTFRGSGKSLAEAAFHAKKMGLSLAQTENIGSKLLDFESSIADEMEAELLLGKDLNLERARSAALQGDLATVAKEVAGQIGSAAEFGKMNVLQQEALAKSVGVSRDELANMLKTQELLAGTGFDDMNQAQAEFKKLLKETGSEEAALAKMKERGASDALQGQLRQVSLQEKRALQERAIAEAQGRMAKAVNKMFDAFNKVNALIKELKTIVVEQMKPFFDAFGGSIEGGGTKLKELLEGPAKKLGKFLNGIGLTLLDTIENIDIDEIVTKAQTFIKNIKDTFTMIKEKVEGIIEFFKTSPFGKLLGGGMATAAAPIAIKLGKTLGKGMLEKGSKANPMFVKQADSGIFDMLSGKKGKKPASLLKQAKTLFKKPQVMARALKMQGGIGGKLGGKALGMLAKGGGKALLKAIPGVGLIATAGMALFDAAKGIKNAEKIFDKKEGEKATGSEKAAASLASALSGLTFGLLDVKTTAKFLDKTFKYIIKYVKNKVKIIGNLFKGIFDNVVTFAKDTFSDIMDFFTNIFSGDFGGAFESIKNIFGNVGTLIMGILGNVVTYFKDTFLSIFGSFGEKVLSALKSPVNGIISIINGLIGKINSALTFEKELPAFLGGGTIGIKTDIPTIPALAEGGIVNQATLAMIGEAGSEAVVPLDKFTESNEKIQQEIRELKEIMKAFAERPVVVELNGNKVGQALGQNSYRIQ